MPATLGFEGMTLDEFVEWLQAFDGFGLIITDEELLKEELTKYLTDPND